MTRTEAWPPRRKGWGVGGAGRGVVKAGHPSGPLRSLPVPPGTEMWPELSPEDPAWVACHPQTKCREFLSLSLKRSFTPGVNSQEGPGAVPESMRGRKCQLFILISLEASRVFWAEGTRVESPQQGPWRLPASGRPCSE